MKVLAILVLIVSSVSARGSGPYLPSGWRPEGPAFYLPSEVSVKSAENPLKDTILQESETSGSEFLREYGLPKVIDVSQDITKQSLPEVATEQAFLIEAKFNQEDNTQNIKEVDNAVIETENAVASEASVEQRTTIEEEIVTVTEQQDIEDVATLRLAEQPLIQGKSINLDIEASKTETTKRQDSEGITDKVVEQPIIQAKTIDLNTEVSLAKTTEDVNGAAIANEEGIIQQEEEKINSEVKSVEEKNAFKEAEIKTIEEGVKNIVETVLKQEENLQVTEARTGEISESLAQFPEGFLEYGPPGFREYGPPKGDELLRSAVEEKSSEAQLMDNNETRRRRFSPKFRTTRRQ